MLADHLESLRIALILFPFMVIPIGIGTTVMQYQRFGQVVLWRTVVIYAFAFFVLAAYALTLLPLPPITPDFCQLYSDARPLWTPFHMFRDIAEAYREQGSITAVLTGTVFLQFFLNFLLLMPLGFFLRYLFRFSFLAVLVASLLMSLSFEVTQLTGIYGLYPCPYRVFDVDDLILNTAGSLVGYLIVPLLSFLPSVRPTEPLPDVVKPVGYLRRIFAFCLDALIVGVIWLLLTRLINLPETPQLYLLLFFLWLTAWAVVTGGHSPGLWLTRLKITTLAGERPKAWQPIVRYGIQFGALLVVIEGVELFTQNAVRLPESWLRPIAVVIFLLLAMLWLAFVIAALLRDDDRSFHELISRTRLWTRPPDSRWFSHRRDTAENRN